MVVNEAGKTVRAIFTAWEKQGLPVAGAAVLTLCGDLLNLPPGYNLHPFESRSPQGRKRARPGADVRG